MLQLAIANNSGHIHATVENLLDMVHVHTIDDISLASYLSASILSEAEVTLFKGRSTPDNLVSSISVIPKSQLIDQSFTSAPAA
jgi:hypothetical protein